MKMNSEDLWTQIWSVVFSWLRTHWLWALVVLGFGVAILNGLTWYQSYYDKRFVILTGPPGSSSWRSAGRIAAKLGETQRTPGINYSVRMRETNGSRDVEEQIRGDRSGQLIGFTDNGSVHPDELRTLLPLDYDYLHVLCRKNFLNNSFAAHAPPRIKAALDLSTVHLEMTAGEKSAESLPSLGEVLNHLRANSVFAGPQGSGCRDLVEKVYRRYGKRPYELERNVNPALNDWEQARAALKMGTVDLVFYLGPLGATTIEEIALQDHSAVLLGLNDIQDALVEHEGYSLGPVTFPNNAYCAASSDSPDQGLGFCEGANRKSVKLRGLLVCSPAMHGHDAFLIAQAAKKALESDSQQIGWQSLPPGYAANSSPDVPRIPEHSNARTQPIAWWSLATWPPGWTSFLASVGLLLLGHFVTTLKAKLTPTEAVDSGIAPEKPVTPFDEQRIALEKLLAELERHGEMSLEEWANYNRSLDQCRIGVLELRQQDKIDDKQLQVLSQALRNIRVELDIEKPAPARKTSRKSVEHGRNGGGDLA